MNGTVAAINWVVWWLSPLDFEALAVCTNINDVPGWLYREIRSARGHSGRGRLWVSSTFPNAPSQIVIDESLKTGIAVYIDRCCGILMPARFVSALQRLPGLITTLSLTRWEPVPSADPP